MESVRDVVEHGGEGWRYEMVRCDVIVYVAPGDDDAQLSNYPCTASIHPHTHTHPQSANTKQRNVVICAPLCVSYGTKKDALPETTNFHPNLECVTYYVRICGKNYLKMKLVRARACALSWAGHLGGVRKVARKHLQIVFARRVRRGRGRPSC